MQFVVQASEWRGGDGDAKRPKLEPSQAMGVGAKIQSAEEVQKDAVLELGFGGASSSSGFGGSSSSTSGGEQAFDDTFGMLLQDLCCEFLLLILK